MIRIGGLNFSSVLSIIYRLAEAFIQNLRFLQASFN